MRESECVCDSHYIFFNHGLYCTILVYLTMDHNKSRTVRYKNQPWTTGECRALWGERARVVQFKGMPLK